MLHFPIEFIQNQFKHMKNTILILLLSSLFWSCNSSSEETEGITIPANPAAAGFNETDSDAKAIALADSVMLAMGGRDAWDNTRYIGWNFFGRRHLLWDKKEGHVRIEMLGDSTVFLVNVKDKKGKALMKGEEITEPDSLSKLMDRAEAIWINDSYWLVMPFKLKDSGVTLKYLGQDTSLNNTMAEVLELTFENIGNTPNNKYHVFIDPDTKLVMQWDYFTNATDEKPRISGTWSDYNKYGDILLSGGRGERGLDNIGVYEEVPQSVFTNFAERFPE